MRHTGGLLRRASMVVQSEANGVEARFWMISGWPTNREESDKEIVWRDQPVLFARLSTTSLTH